MIRNGRGIVQFEMYNVWLAINMWGHKWENSMIKVNCDNNAVVQILNSYKTRDKFLGLCLRNIMLLLAKYNIHLMCTHIRGINNHIADSLSRVVHSNSYK